MLYLQSRASLNLQAHSNSYLPQLDSDMQTANYIPASEMYILGMLHFTLANKFSAAESGRDRCRVAPEAFVPQACSEGLGRPWAGGRRWDPPSEVSSAIQLSECQSK